MNLAMMPELTFPIDVMPDTVEPAVFCMDEEGFRRFYARTARPLKAYLSRISGNVTLADDLLQEAYYRFLRANRPEMDDAGEKNYLFRIATNLLKDHYRQSKRIESPLPEIPTGERIGEKIHLRTDLSRVLQDLKPRERQLLWLAYVEGSTHREIAETVGVKAASVKILLFRARRKLARILRDKGFVADNGS
jgi:RNA polymerase sigma-70 factor (ECF subfamily)